MTVSAKHPFAMRQVIELNELARVPVALPSVTTNIRRAVNGALLKLDLALKISLEVDDTPARFQIWRIGCDRGT